MHRCLMVKIDAHQHFWQLARGDYGWLDHAPQALRRDFMPPDLEPLLHVHGIAGHVEAEVVCLAELHTRLHAAAGQPHREAAAMMIAAMVGGLQHAL